MHLMFKSSGAEWSEKLTKNGQILGHPIGRQVLTTNLC